MDLVAFGHNLWKAARGTATTWDAMQKIAWLYDQKLPKFFRKEERLINLCYELPLGNVKLIVRSNYGADGFIVSEVFDHEYYNLNLSWTPKTVLDLGANIGLTSIYFSRVFNNVQLACVEPMPRNLDLLHRNLAINGVDARVFEAAVDTSDGHTHMDIDQLDYGFKVAKEGLEVRTVSVPTVMAEMGWDTIDLLKIDIEGHESAILKSSCDWLFAVNAICIEVHDDYTENDLIELALKYNFKPPRSLSGNWLIERFVERC